MDANAPPFTHHGWREGCPGFLTPDESGDPFFTPQQSFSTKPSEVWALGGYGLVVSRPRIVQIKRSYRRACFRALQHGYTATRLTEKATYLPQMCHGVFEKPIDASCKRS